MKIALYIEDGLEQLVLTPETKAEKAILDKIHDGTRLLEIHRGAFYGCRGGWTRMKPGYFNDAYTSTGREEDESTMIVLRPGPPPPAPEQPE